MNLFIDGARQWWRMWSVRLAAVTGIVAATLTAHPAILLGLIGFLPRGPMQYVIAAIVGLLVFGVPTLTRVLSQPKLEKPDGK